MALIKTFFARDPHLMLSFNAADGWELLDNYRFYVAVEILEADGVTWTQVMASEHTPDTTDTVKVNVKPAFRGVFAPVPPTFNLPFDTEQSLEEWNKTIIRFRTKSGPLTGTLVVPAAPTTTADYLVIMGGLTKFKFKTIAPFFTSYLVDNKKFMTWAPLEKLVDKMQEDFLNFYFPAAPPANIVRTRITAYYDDATSETANVLEQSVVTWGLDTQLWRIQAGPLNSGAYTINLAKNLVKYEIWLANNANVALSEKRTYIIDPVSYPNKRFLLFMNSLGAWESLRFYGDTVERERYQRQVVRVNLPDDYAATQGEYAQTFVEGQTAKEMGSGYFLETDSKEWLLYMRDLMKSPKIFDVTTGTRRPLMITSGELAGPQSRSYKHSVRFEAIEAYSDEVYTPDNA